MALRQRTWTWRDSNPHTPACKADARPVQLQALGLEQSSSQCSFKEKLPVPSKSFRRRLQPVRLAEQGRSGGRIRTLNLLLNRELPIQMGLTGMSAARRSRTPSLGFEARDVFPYTTAAWRTRPLRARAGSCQRGTEPRIRTSFVLDTGFTGRLALQGQTRFGSSTGTRTRFWRLRASCHTYRPSSRERRRRGSNPQPSG